MRKRSAKGIGARESSEIKQTKCTTLYRRSQSTTVASAGWPSVWYSFSKHGERRKKRSPNCFARAERDFDSVRDWCDENAGRRNQVVRGRRARGRFAETGRLLAHGVGG